MTEPLTYSPDEVATILGLHSETVYRWLRSGRMPGRKVGGLWIISAERLRRWRAGQLPGGRPAVVYRFFDRQGTLLYIGMTVAGPARWAGHAAEKPWWQLVAHVTLVHYESETDAHVAERRAIALEQPLHNVHHRTWSPSVARRPAS